MLGLPSGHRDGQTGCLADCAITFSTPPQKPGGKLFVCVGPPAPPAGTLHPWVVGFTWTWHPTAMQWWQAGMPTVQT